MCEATNVLKARVSEMKVEIEQLRRKGKEDIAKEREERVKGIEYSIRVIKYVEGA